MLIFDWWHNLASSIVNIALTIRHEREALTEDLGLVDLSNYVPLLLTNIVATGLVAYKFW